MKEKETIYFRAWDNEKENKSDGSKVLRLPQKIVDDLEKKHYGVYGHSAVQICSWTKKALRGEGVCYKTKFYGIDCHSCMEMTPAVMWCQENCSFCWRPMEFMKNIEINPDEVDDSKEIIDTLIEKRKKLLSGFGGHPSVNRKLWELSQTPTHYAFSLSGEPTMYPHLDKMVEYLRTLKATKSVFIVTNAQIPEFFEKLEQNEKAMPTQIYVSLEAPTRELFDKINKSLYKDGWERLHRSLEIFSRLNTRKVLRFTLLKGVNDKREQFEQYKSQVLLSNADFIEVKGYVHIGMSQDRHTKEDMPTFDEIESFSEDFAKYMENYEYVHSSPNSRITLLRRIDSPYNMRIDKFENEK